MISFISLLLFLYLLVLFYLMIYQRKLMYEPDKNIGAPGDYGLSGFEETFLKNADGLTLQCWYRQANQGFPTIIYYHGNAMHIGNRAGIYGALAAKGFGVFALSYRGFGKSEGSPTERGIYQDARTAMEFLLKEQYIPLKKIIIYGESLGTGVAVQMATEYEVGALILQAAYLSVAGRAAEIYFYIPVRWLIADRYDSISKISKVKAPLLLFHGERDTTIPIRHGRTLFAAANEPKQAFFLAEASHNDFDSQMISAHVLDFAKTYRLAL